MQFLLKIAITALFLGIQLTQAYPSSYRDQEKGLSQNFLASLNKKQVNYLLTNEKKQVIARPVYKYTGNGYEAAFLGKINSFVITENSAVMTVDGVVITIILGNDNYWHNDVNTWKRRPLRTSVGELGVADVLYAGVYSGKFIFHERFFIGANKHFQTITALNEKGYIVCSKRLDSDGFLFLEQIDRSEECPFENTNDL